MPVAIVRRFPSSLALMTPCCCRALLLPRPPLRRWQTSRHRKKHKQRCPDDLVVWLDLPTPTYYYRGQRWYGSTKNGTYVCRNEAVRAGMGYAKCGMNVPAGFIDPPGYTGKFRP